MSRTAGSIASAAAAWLATAPCTVAYAATAPADPGTPARLEALPIAPGSVTVSGISAGGYMAVQFHVVHSSLVAGAGVIAAGPYDCARGSVTRALSRCTKDGEGVDAASSIDRARALADSGRIDPLSGLTDDRVWLFHGGADPFVGKTVVDALQGFYEALAGAQAVRRVDLPAAAHTFPAQGDGLAACGVTESPFVGACGLDGAREILQHLYGAFAANTAAPRLGELRTFDQRTYAASAHADGLATQGWIYVPAACEAEAAAPRCRLHVVFHGCRQGASFVGDAFVRRAGYLAAADAGNVVVLFPQAQPSLRPLNPNGCWDWWGYTGENYATRDGAQIVAIRAMVDDLTGAIPPPNSLR